MTKKFTQKELEAAGFVAPADASPWDLAHFFIPMGVTAEDFDRLPAELQDQYGDPDDNGERRAKWMHDGR